MHRRIKIESDDPEIERLLRDLAQQVTNSGGFLHPELKIHIENGQLTVRSGATGPGPLVMLPGPCLIPVDAVEFELDGDDIVVSAYPHGMGRNRQTMLDTLIAIYNQGDKIHHHRLGMPWLAFASAPLLLETLYQARADGPNPIKFHKLARENKLEQLALESFIGTRTLNYKTGSEPLQTVLMPFIDFFDHHAASPPFGRHGDALSVSPSHPVPGSSECFVCYSALDAMDTYLNYGFADASAPFLRSVPVLIDLPGIGSIRILGRALPASKHPPPPALKDLRDLMPTFLEQSGNDLTASHLFVPGANAPMSLHRILGAAIQHLAPHLTRDELWGTVDIAVRQVLYRNESYYSELERLLVSMVSKQEPAPALDQLKRLIDIQQQRLAVYRASLSRIKPG